MVGVESSLAWYHAQQFGGTVSFMSARAGAEGEATVHGCEHGCYVRWQSEERLSSRLDSRNASIASSIRKWMHTSLNCSLYYFSKGIHGTFSK